MTRANTLCVALSLLSFTAAYVHTIEYAHVTQRRTVFSVYAPTAGRFPCRLKYKNRLKVSVSLHQESPELLVNGRSLNKTLSLLPLRRGSNTIALLLDAMKAGLQGIELPGTRSSLSVGGSMPFSTVEAEDSSCSGTVIGLSYDAYTQTPNLPAEASGRRACQLSEPGDFVEFRFFGLSLCIDNNFFLFLRCSLSNFSSGLFK